MLFVYSGAATMVAHALFSYGAKYALLYAVITFGAALAIEELGSRTGWPFGQYHYSPSLGYQIFGVPLVVPCAWIMMAHPILLVARKIAPRWVFLIGGLGLMTWDLFIDPQMVAAGRWSWKIVGPHVPLQSAIPLSNTAGWLLSGMALIAILNRVLPKERRKVGASAVVVEIFLAWTLMSGVIGNVFFFHTPGVAVSAAIPFIALLIPYYFISHLGRPDQF
jgi:putative membrane protein